MGYSTERDYAITLHQPRKRSENIKLDQVDKYQAVTLLKRPSNCRPCAGLMLVQRLRRWTNIKPTRGARFVFGR